MIEAKDITKPVIIVASFGNATVKRTLYGPVSPERFEQEHIDARRRAEQLDTSKPDKKISRREPREREQHEAWDEPVSTRW